MPSAANLLHEKRGLGKAVDPPLRLREDWWVFEDLLRLREDWWVFEDLLRLREDWWVFEDLLRFKKLLLFFRMSRKYF